MSYSIEDLNEKYDLELDEVAKKIKSEKAKLVLLQFPDGLKPYATSVVDYLEKALVPKGVPRETSEEVSTEGTQFLIFLGTCFGACDTPVGLEGLKIDLTIQFGHNSLMPEF